VALKARTEAGATLGIAERVWIADVDVHLNESPTSLAAYCDPSWRDALLELEHVTKRYLDVPGLSIGWDGIDPPIPGRFTAGEEAGNHPDWETRTVADATQMRTELAALGISAAILFPDHLLTLAALPNPRYACALARAYNRWLTAEWIADPAGGLYGALVAAPHDPAEAAREIRAHAAHGQVVAVYLPTAAINPLWGHRMYDPIFDAAEEAGLPVVLHSVGIIHPNFPHQVHGVEPAGARHALVHPFGMIANLVSMIGTGVPVRFPGLRIAFTEGGVSWVPWVAWRLDKEYIERRREFPFYSEQPSRYVKHFFFATQPIEEPEEPQALVQLLDLFGITRQIMFASDWPHHDFDHPSQVLRLPFSQEDQTAIMGGTAKMLFGLP
jgi:uncharacterized protein